MNHSDDSVHPPQGSFRDHEGGKRWEVENDQQLGGSFSGAVHVHESARFEITQDGDHQGHLVFHPRSGGHLAGRHVGPLDLGKGSSVEISGIHSGPVEISAGAVLKVRPGGSLSGSLHVAGLVETVASEPATQCWSGERSTTLTAG